MKKTLTTILFVTIASLGLTATAAAADSKDECGAALEGNWIVKHGGDIKKHLKHHLKIDKSSNSKYAVKIKNQEGDVLFKSAKDFIAACSNESGKVTLTGDVKMGNCMHALEIRYPHEADGVSIKINTVHDKGECAGHKDALHEGDRHKHSTTASGKRRGK